MNARVLTITDSLSVGGVQTHLVALCAELNRGPYKTDVFSLVRMKDFFSGQIAATGSKVVFGGERPTALPLVMWRLARMIRDGHYSIIHTYLPASFLIGTLVARALGHRNLVTTVCAREEQIHGRILAFRNYRRLDGVTRRFMTPFPSQLARIGIRQEKIRFCMFAADFRLHERIDRREENPLVAQYGLEGAYPIVLSVGRLHVDKGHEFAIRAVEELRKTHPAARLLILGEGHDEARLRAVAGKGNPAVTFCGIHEKLAPFYSLADLFIHPAVNEGLNLSQLNAMANGVPTVAFDTGFLEYEQQGKERAMARVPLRDVKGLAAAMNALLADPNGYRSLQENGRAFAAQYEKSRVVQDYVRVYEELCPLA